MFYLTLRKSAAPRIDWTVTLEEHLTWMREQHARGTIIMSGPTPDRQLGIYIIRAPSREDAGAIAAADPYTAAGFCTYEIIEWDVHEILGTGFRSPA